MRHGVTFVSQYALNIGSHGYRLLLTLSFVNTEMYIHILTE